MFEVVTTTLGVKSIRNTVVNEIMHNPVGPWAEANHLYIDQSNLRSRLTSGTGDFVIFDVGLGAAANALATLHVARELKSTERRPLRLISFERDLELLRFALLHAGEFEHFKGYEAAIQGLLNDHKWQEDGVEWLLHEGEFPELIKSGVDRPHLIFFDPYSPEVNREMWTVENFKNLRAISREPQDGGTLLLTYSRATPIRTSLLLAGFFIGRGNATGLKDETTQASTDLALLSEPMGEKWLERWRRSHTPFPFGTPEFEMVSVRARVEEYFAGLSTKR